MYSGYYNNQQQSSHGQQRGGEAQNLHVDENAALAILQHLDKDDLEKLLSDENKLQELIKDLQQVKSIQVERETLMASNKSLAEYNLSLQPKLDDLKRRVATAYEAVNNCKTELGKHKAQLDIYAGEQSLDTLLALLQTETAKSEDESELLAEDFCDNKFALEDFVGEYLPKRTLAHKRRIKSEKMSELLRNLHVHNHPTLHGQNPPVPPANQWSMRSQPPGGGGGAPYPMYNAPQMPQPSMFR